MILGVLLRYGDKKQGGVWDQTFGMPWNYHKMAEKCGVTLCGIIRPEDAEGMDPLLPLGLYMRPAYLDK